MTKSELRREFLTKRGALTAVDVRQRSHQIASRFFTYFENQKLSNYPGFIHTFLPIARQNEVDTWPIVHRLWRERLPVRVGVSVADLSTNRLRHYLLTPTTPLTENAWGIPEPPPTAHPLLPTDFDAVLVPLLAFDRQGHRVGYGKGYYDRFLAECRPDCPKIGLSLVEPIDRIDDVEPTDVRLDMCFTPTQTWFF